MSMYDSSDDDDDEPPALVDLAPAAPPPLIDDPTPCPVTILSGFLGSGKTTLIQYILKDPNHGKRIAVIENEFGEGLAVESLIARDGVNNSLQDLIELPNGCICCTVKDSLVATLENLVSKKTDLDYIIIEASGMANPGPIASVFWLDDALESRLRLDGIVTIVDAYHILQQLQTTEEAAQQIAYADRILINKVDLVDSEYDNNNKTGTTMETIQATIRQLHPSAPFKCTTYSQVPDLDWILGANCFGGAKRLEELDSVWAQVQQTNDNNTAHSHDHSHSHSHDHSEGHGDANCQLCQQSTSIDHNHTASVVTIALEHSGSVDLSKLNKWLADILWPDQDQSNKVLMAMLKDTGNNKDDKNNKKTTTQIFRIKGIVSIRTDDEEETSNQQQHQEQSYIDPSTGLDKRRYIVQAVHDLWEVHPASDNLQWESDEERVCKMILIGKRLHYNDLQAGFLSCFV